MITKVKLEPMTATEFESYQAMARSLYAAEIQRASGCSAEEASNNHNPHRASPNWPVSHSYAELDLGYRENWSNFSRLSPIPYIVPMTSGWDKRPWGGSTDPLHDLSLSTPAEFAQHLEAARSFIRANPEKTMGMGVICCWNEFGEGSFIEPTKAQGFQFVSKVREVFREPVTGP